jgi:hypothetical protein
MTDGKGWGKILEAKYSRYAQHRRMMLDAHPSAHLISPMLVPASRSPGHSSLAIHEKTSEVVVRRTSFMLSSHLPLTIIRRQTPPAIEFKTRRAT